MASILGGIQDNRACFPLGWLAPSNAANMRLCRGTGQTGHHTRVHRPCEQPQYRTGVQAVQAPPLGGPAFTPCLKARALSRELW
jgi:hypothetical protein